MGIGSADRRVVADRGVSHPDTARPLLVGVVAGSAPAQSTSWRSRPRQQARHFGHLGPGWQGTFARASDHCPRRPRVRAGDPGRGDADWRYREPADRPVGLPPRACAASPAPKCRNAATCTPRPAGPGSAGPWKTLNAMRRERPASDQRCCWPSSPASAWKRWRRTTAAGHDVTGIQALPAQGCAGRCSPRPRRVIGGEHIPFVLRGGRPPRRPARAPPDPGVLLARRPVARRWTGAWSSTVKVISEICLYPRPRGVE